MVADVSQLGGIARNGFRHGQRPPVEWQRNPGDSSVVGSTIDLTGHPMTVIGVAEPRFIGAMLLHPMELWFPLTAISSLVPGMRDNHTDTYVRLVGRLAAGHTPDDAQREFSIVAKQLASVFPAEQGHGIRVIGGAGMTVEERTGLARLPRLLAIAVGLLLLIPCANVANLSLVRAAARRRELATRLSCCLSQLRGLVLRTVGVMTLIGGSIGIAAALAFGRAARSLLYQLQAYDPVMIAGAAGALAMVAFAAGFLPAFKASRVDPIQALRYE